MKYECTLCGYIYDPDLGNASDSIRLATPFADLPSDWTCPECGAAKEDFEPIE